MWIKDGTGQEQEFGWGSGPLRLLVKFVPRKDNQSGRDKKQN